MQRRLSGRQAEIRQSDLRAVHRKSAAQIGYLQSAPFDGRKTADPDPYRSASVINRVGRQIQLRQDKVVEIQVFFRRTLQGAVRHGIVG